MYFSTYLENFGVLCVDCFWAWVSLQILVIRQACWSHVTAPKLLFEAKALLISLLGAVQNIIFEFLKTLKQG